MTLLTAPVDETDKTDETIHITNRAFLEAIFRYLPVDQRGFTVSFPGNPKNGNWSATVWDQNRPELPLNNNYFSLSSYKAGPKGSYKRRSSQFADYRALMLDDVGTKVSLDRLTLEPSWLLETSPGNFQAGYILIEPIADPAVANRLCKAAIEAGLCDRGADGPTARLARLPVGVNGKSVPPFPCKLHKFNGDLRYSMEDIVSGLQLDLQQQKTKQAASELKARRVTDSGQILLPSPIDNPIISGLKARGLYKCEIVPGKHDTTCPWVIEHTEEADGGTAYFEPNENYPIGGFKCFHGHCAHRHIADLLEFLDIEKVAARMKPTIRLQAGELARISDLAEFELAKTKIYYQRGGLIVRICLDRSSKELGIKELKQPPLSAALAAAITWEIYDGRTKDWRRVDPPMKHVSVLYEAPEYRHLPTLSHLARQPFLRADGSVVMNSGYDAETETYGVFSPEAFDIPEQPTKEQAQQALNQLLGILSEFSFATQADQAAAVSAFLTAAVRASLPFAPMFHTKAAQKGSGKSYLNRLIQSFSSSQPDAPLPFPKDDEECKKLLLARLLVAPAVIEFDNLTTDLLPHNSLCTAITSEHLSGRILGVSKTATVGTRTLFLSSGNNVGPVQDMARRTITIELDPACEMPAMRTFQNPHLITEVLKNREKYVSAAILIARAWIVAGRPRTPCKALAGFELWSDYCRQTLLWLGLPDPAEKVFKAMNEDPDREILGRFLNAWYELFGSAPTMGREVVHFSPPIEADFSGYPEEMNELLSDIAGEKGGTINNRRLGRWIARQSGVIVNGLRFRRSTGKRSAEAWIVEKVI